MTRRVFLTASAAAPLLAGPEPKLAADPHRPQYHFLPAANWMNDPNGPIYRNGKCHLFYQYNPNGAFWGTMHWGHAVSEDLVRWKHLPVAMAPTPGGPDKDGVFSGCAVVRNGVPTLVYTGVNPEVQCIATSDEQMIRWTKYPGNPVIAAPPEGVQVTGFRDPCVWVEGDTWYMAVGSGFAGTGGAALLYRSPDLIHWTYLHPLHVGQMDEAAKGKRPVATGEMWECPEFIPLGGKHVLIVSTEDTTRYFSGRYADYKFHAEREGETDFGVFYAPKSMLDARGRRILWGWIRERRSEKAQREAGWSGVMSLPRVLSLRSDGRLGIAPAPELEALRGDHKRVSGIVLQPGTSSMHAGGDAIEILAQFEPGESEEVGLQIASARDGQEHTLISYNVPGRRLYVDKQRSSLNADTDHGVEWGSFSLSTGEPLELRVFLDGSVIEVYANGRACISDRIYPTREDSIGVGAFARGRGAALLRSMDVWQMQPISSDRLTT